MAASKLLPASLYSAGRYGDPRPAPTRRMIPRTVLFPRCGASKGGVSEASDGDERSIFQHQTADAGDRLIMTNNWYGSEDPRVTLVKTPGKLYAYLEPSTDGRMSFDACGVHHIPACRAEDILAFKFRAQDGSGAIRFSVPKHATIKPEEDLGAHFVPFLPLPSFTSDYEKISEEDKAGGEAWNSMTEMEKEAFCVKAADRIEREKVADQKKMEEILPRIFRLTNPPEITIEGSPGSETNKDDV